MHPSYNTMTEPELRQVVTICAHDPHGTVAWRDTGVEHIATGCRTCLPGIVAEAIDHAAGGLLSVKHIEQAAV